MIDLSHVFLPLPSRQSRQPGSQLTGIDQRADNLEGEDTSSKIPRITRDEERTLDNASSRIIRAWEEAVIAPGLVPEPASRQEEEDGRSRIEENRNATEREADLAGNAPRSTRREPETRARKSPGRGWETGERVASALGGSKSGTSFSRISDSGATTAVAMVVIGVIMLVLAPTVIILRILDERKQARKLVALSSAREDLPPAYEQVVFTSEEAPRYSTLSLNDDYSSPPPSATASLIKSNST
ncbi:hypothetical protein X777_01664 [Ooceraea biroi]|uniref:Uncharacterized protein n=1 Tax=Ooceraea biroi TaxID=2015173 RepID=A0A026WM71_OOCBI|nr:hypothetical protein X777_01664 [Ooceraea biroi]